jgi:hypothetical protein
MKKIIFLGLCLLVISCNPVKYSKTRALVEPNTGTGPNTETGESLYSFAEKMKLVTRELNRVQITEDQTTAPERNILHNGQGPNTVNIRDIALLIAQVDAALTDNTPTDAQITSALGMTAAVAGKNYTRIIKDTSGSGLIYLCISDGTSWMYIKFTIAV